MAVWVSSRKTLPARCLDSVEGRFEKFVGELGRLYDVTLPLPSSWAPGPLKKFCSDLLEGGCHSWSPVISGLSRTSRWSLAFSLFLFRKTIPSEEPQVGPYVERMSTPSDLPDASFVKFACRETRRLFPLGWDRSYRDKCCTSTLPTTSCSESGRQNGGCRGLVAQDRWDREDFCRYVLESVRPGHRGVSRVQAVETGGKWRTISIPPRIDNALRPLHQCMYDHLSKERWLLRGDAKASRFSEFTTVPGEFFVSGDYESATDNLNGYLQSAIFRELLSNARTIPDGIRSHAESIFRSALEGGGVSAVQQRGQLMGQLTSFPLLCLTNYLTFKYFVRRDTPVLINGDDIVFRGTSSEFSRWSSGVKKGGLTLSAGKTLTDSRFFSLNSCLFKSGQKRARAVPFVRPKALWGTKERMCEKIAALAPRFRSFCPGYGGERRRLLNTFFLKENLGTIACCRRSLTRGMGMKVGRGSLQDSGLWYRELFYLEKWTEPELPFFSFSQMKCNDLPVGWTRVSPYRHPRLVVKGWQDRLAISLVNNAWSSDVVVDRVAEQRWMEACHTGVEPWGLGKWTSARLARLSKLSRRQLWQSVYIRRNESLFGRVRFSRGKSVMMPESWESSDVPVLLSPPLLRNCPEPALDFSPPKCFT